MSTPLCFLNNLATVHVNEPTLSIVELSGAPGDTPPLHVHTDEDETFYVLDGEITVHIAGQDPLVLSAGQAAFAPRGVPHVYVVTSETPGRWLGTSTGHQFASFVEALSTPAAEPTLPGRRRHRPGAPSPPSRHATASSCSARPACCRRQPATRPRHRRSDSSPFRDAAHDRQPRRGRDRLRDLWHRRWRRSAGSGARARLEAPSIAATLLETLHGAG